MNFLACYTPFWRTFYECNKLLTTSLIILVVFYWNICLLLMSHEYLSHRKNRNLFTEPLFGGA